MVKVGLVGVGFMGTMHANVYNLLGNAELVAATGKHPDQLQAFGEKFGVKTYATMDEMLASETLDVVDICLPTHLHRDATVHALDAGKHVVCEKPMALSVDEANAMIDAMERSGKRLFIAHCIRFWPEYAFLKEAVEDERFGRLLSLNLTRYGQFPYWSSDNWLADENLSGGGVLDMHIHDTDFALYLMGDPQQMHSWGTIDERGASHVFTTMQYAGGTVVHLEGGWNLPTNSPFKMAFRAIFERGAMIFDGGPLTVFEPNNEPVVPHFEAMAAEGGGNISDLGGYFLELKYFYDCLENREVPSVCTPYTSRKSLATTLEEIRQIKFKAG
jgi:predicted dehydrogenase